MYPINVSRFRSTYWQWLLLFIRILCLYGVTSFISYPTLYSANDNTPDSTNANTVTSQNLTQTSGANFAPFLDIVPSQDGNSVFVNAGGVGQLPATTLFANVGIGPTGHKVGWSMNYSTTIAAYTTNISGFSPTTTEDARLNITTTTGLATGEVQFLRSYIEESSLQDIDSNDGSLRLSLLNTDTFASDVYIAIAPSFALPAPLPAGYTLGSTVYSVRASGSILTSEQPFILRLNYLKNVVKDVSPYSLGIVAWDAGQKRWLDSGGVPFTTQGYLSASTTRLTTYAVVATPRWRDAFYSFAGLDFGQSDNITVAGVGEQRALVLANKPGTGFILSQPITAPQDFLGWDTLSYTGSIAPPTTTLAIDILDINGRLLLSDVQAGTDLSAIDPQQHPSLRLRTRLTSTVAGVTSHLYSWQLGWKPKVETPPEQHFLFLPLVTDQ